MMENKQLLTKDTVLDEVWCADVPGSDDVCICLGNFELIEQTDEYEIYSADDVICGFDSFNIKVYRDSTVMPGGDMRLAKSSVETVNVIGEKVPEMFVFEVVEGYDTYKKYTFSSPSDSSEEQNDEDEDTEEGTTAEEDAATKDNTDSDENSTGDDDSIMSLRGFAAVAGMNDLKKEMLDEVKWVIDNKEKAAKYGLHVPNGMLLYGYPGCGKTFFAEKLAEELGVTFMFKRGSELGNHYMHQTEQNIGELFTNAKAQAPCIICIDEIDGFLPYRRDSEGPDGAFLNSEVNEFLSQMNNCGKDGVMVIGTTNNPMLIDPALLRTGRMDKLVYVPLPDMEARTEMLKLMARNLPCEEGIDYTAVSEASDGMVMSDMECMFHQVAMKCAREDIKLSTDILTTAAKEARRSVYIPKEEDKQEQQVPITRTVRKIVGFGQVS